jgi:hypothetical protein
MPAWTRRIAPGGDGGLDAALVLVHFASLVPALAAVKKGGRIAYPNGVDVLALRAGEPAPAGPEGVAVLEYDGVPYRRGMAYPRSFRARRRPGTVLSSGSWAAIRHRSRVPRGASRPSSRR